MQVYERFKNGVRHAIGEINVTFISTLTGFSKDTVRLAMEKSRRWHEQRKMLLDENAKQVLEKRKNEGRGRGTERSG